MELKHLKIIRDVYNQIQSGISNPILINTAYGLLPNHIDGAPMRAKIQAITRFNMLSYDDEYKIAVNASKQVEVLPIIPEEASNSIGTVENKSSQSHSESTDMDEIKLNREFLTKEEKEDLAKPNSKTEFNIVKEDGRKKGNRRNRQ